MILWIILGVVVAALAVGLLKLMSLTLPGMYFGAPANVEEFVIFKDAALKRRYAKKTIPMEVLMEAYFDEKVDFKGEIVDVLKNRDLFTNYAMTWGHYKFLLTRFLPEVLIHSKAEDERMVRWHYDRGDDFFNWFLGPRMIYTSAYYKTVDGSEGLEKGQDQKMDLVCRKLHMKPGHTHLDIGCGWGTLVTFSAKNYGARSTGITISENQTKYGNKQIAEAGVSDRSEVLCLDYRDIPNKVWDRISCLEMAEHVGVKNFLKFLKQVHGLLADDGLFLLQICGLRRHWQWRDLVWGLFMNKYIFPGADASTPMGFIVDNMEKAGFEIFSVENISWHYGLTIYQWYKNWVKNREQIVKKYGERWYRIWNLFLSWSFLISREGTAACFQVVVNKNTNKFDRSVFVTNKTVLG